MGPVTVTEPGNKDEKFLEQQGAESVVKNEQTSTLPPSLVDVRYNALSS
jgi:hypothetical protein